MTEQVQTNLNPLSVETEQTKPVHSNKRFFIIMAIFGLIILLLILLIILININKKSTGVDNNLVTTLILTETIMPTVTEIQVSPTDNVTVTMTNLPTSTIKPTSKPIATNTAVPFAVTNVTISANTSCYEYNGLNPTPYPFEYSFNITGTITTNGAGTVTYKWQPIQPVFFVPLAAKSLVFSGAGTKAVEPIDLTLSIGNWQVDWAYGSIKLKVFTPSEQYSNIANVTLDNNKNNIHACP